MLIKATLDSIYSKECCSLELPHSVNLPGEGRGINCFKSKSWDQPETPGGGLWVHAMYCLLSTAVIEDQDQDNLARFRATPPLARSRLLMLSKLVHQLGTMYSNTIKGYKGHCHWSHHMIAFKYLWQMSWVLQLHYGYTRASLFLGHT